MVGIVEILDLRVEGQKVHLLLFLFYPLKSVSWDLLQMTEEYGLFQILIC